MSVEPPELHQDPQTGTKFKVVLEDRKATWSARLTGVYLIVSSAAWLWLLFDIWSGNNHFIQWAARQWDVNPQACLSSPTFRLVAYSLVGGGLGGVINGFRGFIFWHCECGAFGVRFIWKHVMFPIQGAVLGLVVYAMLRSGVSILSGTTKMEATGSLQGLAFFSTGVLAGYGAQSVFRWLDYRISQVFKFSRH
jgi:hypothetical protein